MCVGGVCGGVCGVYVGIPQYAGGHLVEREISVTIGNLVMGPGA